MPDHERRIPKDPLAFVKRCIEGRQVFWKYHADMRFGEHRVHREMVLSAMDTFEIIEEYPEDKYLPSYLVRAEYGALVLHVQIATDLPGESI